MYTYDNAGNRTSYNEGTFTLDTFTATDYQEPIVYTYAEGWGDQLIYAGDNYYLYDAMGNMVARYSNEVHSSLLWEGRRLKLYEDGTGYYFEYKYDSEGRRISEISASSGTISATYEYNGDKLVCERFGRSICYYIYDESGSIAGMRYRVSSYAAGVFDEYYFEKNLQGDVVAVYNASGTKLISYAYDAWGNFTTTYHNGGASTTAVNNPFRYRGYYYDEEIGLYYLNSRYYDPVAGRFISADSYVSTGQGLIGYNMYAYCNNNPVNLYDPSGQFPFLGVIAAIFVGGGAMAATANDIYQVTSGNVYVNSDVTNDENVHVQNSYKLLTPWMRYGYSFYLNHFNEQTKDVIQGSTYGIQFEWEFHNYAAWLGFGESAKHLDVGKTIFSDGKAHPLIDKDGNVKATGVMSAGMRIIYRLTSIYGFSDYIINGEF